MTFFGRTVLIITWIPVALTVTFTPLSRAENVQFQDPWIRLARWAEATVNFVRNLNCTEVFLTRERECRKLVQVPQEQMNLYAAGPTSRGQLAAVLPDGALSRSGAHNVVLVLDPYPHASFGHLVVVFFLDTLWSELQCRINGGFYIGQGDCLSLALKNRCRNLLSRRSRRRNLVRRCEINFLPFVHVADHPPRGQEDQQLRCYDNVPGFAPCPSFRPENETTRLACDPLHVNTQRCSTTHETVHTRCRISEICDQAVLLSGGWSRLTSHQESLNDLRSVFHMLRNVGFPKRNIKIFFANGVENFEVIGGESHPLYPSIFKLALRYHVKKLCDSPRCVDTLVMYLNSPAMNDGTSLLWDSDGNGQVREDETLTVGEIMEDLENCSARHVLIIADQSFSGQLVKSFNRSTRHVNVQVFTSGNEREYSWQAELTKHWVSFGHQNSCVDQVYQMFGPDGLAALCYKISNQPTNHTNGLTAALKASQRAIKMSNPMMFDGSRGTWRKTLFGAPCDVTPPLSRRTLHQDYYGCQNIFPSE